METIRIKRIITGVLVCALVYAGFAAGRPPSQQPAPAAASASDPNAFVNLSTPQACLENFILSCRDENFTRAARSLNLQYIRPRDANKAAALSRKLFHVLNQKTIISWTAVPDRPDGKQTRQTLSSQKTATASNGKPDHNILLDSIDLAGRDIEIRIRRYDRPDSEPVWQFAANTVENIDALYERFGPGLLDAWMPEWLKFRFWGQMPVWEWVMLVVLLAVCTGIGWAVQKITTILLIKSPKAWSRGLAESIPLPIAAAACLITFYTLAMLLLSLSGPFGAFFTPLMMMLIIIAVTWLLMRIIAFFSTWLSERYSKHLWEDNDTRAGQMLTYTTIIQKVLILIALFLGLGIALSQFDIFKTLAFSMLASAGVAGVVVGVAAHGILSNMMAGIQIAVAQPINIGDNVLFEGNWGNVEGISYTYVTILTWDQRRIIVPLKYLLNHPIENWSKKDSHLIKPITFHVDYHIDVEKVRRKFEELLEASDEWDREKDPTLQVLECREETLLLRALCSAKTPSAAWTLHCKLREEMNAWIQQLDDGRYLPKKRLLLENPDSQPPTDEAGGQ